MTGESLFTAETVAVVPQQVGKQTYTCAVAGWIEPLIIAMHTGNDQVHPYSLMIHRGLTRDELEAVRDGLSALLEATA